MEFTHLLFWVDDNTLSEKFYRKLGFEVIKSTEEISVVQMNNLQIELVPMRDEAEFARDAINSDRGKGMYVYVKVGDVNKEYQRLNRLKLDIKHEPRNWPWGRREFVVKDPDGYKFCMWQNIS